ncbi:MAG TPA: glycosyltransferase [Niabella sp.]|nr:glycosyltransferase [Niabella sp.]HQW14877.1 glycosyltransferase [Niabella sp.]HQX18498.1 glycosyltransferase [Niabella sp.]HQX41496.1 glycosyltransferase [Niabella sp.]HRB06025.1 glycosyltransferase [Niabella sp.]
MPRFSIILPVKNGGNYIKSCIESVLNQRIADFELIILENQSTDKTLEIIQSFRDDRISVVAADTALAIQENWARIVQIPKGTFMTIIGHDDLLLPDYLEEMSRLITNYPDCSLYQTHFNFIDGGGKFLRSCRPMKPNYTKEEAIATFMLGGIDLMGTGFMMRARDYDEVGGIPPYPNLLFADMELFIALALKGGMAVSDKKCFEYRIHQNATTSSSSTDLYYKGFDHLVQYLIHLKSQLPAFTSVIENNGEQFMHKYSQTIVHKILKIKKRQRQTIDVSEMIRELNSSGSKLIGRPYAASQNAKTKLAAIIDKSKLLHSLYLLFRKMYKKPVFVS